MNTHFYTLCCVKRLFHALAEAGSFGFQVHAFYLVLAGKLQEPFVRDLAADVILLSKRNAFNFSESGDGLNVTGILRSPQIWTM